MCKRMQEMADRINEERHLPKGSPVALTYYCNCEECIKQRPRY